MFPRAYARVVVLRVLKVLRILGDKNSNKINILEGVWWKDMGCMVEGYGVYGGRIWGVWWKDMGCMVEGYGVLKNKGFVEWWKDMGKRWKNLFYFFHQ